MRISHKQAYSDHYYLWKEYGEAADMTGAYVDQGDLAELLRSPNAKTAVDCLTRQITYWFSVGFGDSIGRLPEGLVQSDFRLQEIAERYGLYEYL